MRSQKEVRCAGEIRNDFVPHFDRGTCIELHRGPDGINEGRQWLEGDDTNPGLSRARTEDH